MATPESKVKAAVRKALVEAGVWYFSPAANGYGRAGIPDMIACINGHFVAIECKAGKGKTTALQERELQRISEAGGFAMVVSDDPESFREMANIIRLLQLKEKP
jgi:Holliday junction resolvase